MDPDGYAIKNLLLTMFWTLCPEMVIDGRIWAAVPPLFRITTNKNKYIFLRDAKTLKEYKEAHVGQKYLVNRNKGLGEQDSDELRECILDPATRNIVQIVVNDVPATDDMFDILMGPTVTRRKEYMAIHGGEARI